MVNVMIAGIGGQGTVLASKLIAAAAMRQGLDIRTTETIGMAQRGGSVVSHVRMGKQIYSPLIELDTADLIIAFEPAEGARLLPYLSHNGKMIICNGAVQPVTGSVSGNVYSVSDVIAYLKKHVKQLVIIDKQEILKQCDNKMLNVALIGAAYNCGIFPFSMDDLKAVIYEKFKKSYVEPNLNALEAGYNIGKKGGSI